VLGYELVANPQLIGELVGAGFVSGAVGYFLAHKVLQEQQVEHEADAVKARKLYRLRAAILPLAALCAAVLGAGAMSFVSRHFLPADDPELAAAGKEGMLTGCQRTCSQHSDAAECARFCACVMQRIDAKYPEATAFVNFMKLLGTDRERLQAELAPMQAECAAENRSPR